MRCLYENEDSDLYIPIFIYKNNIGEDIPVIPGKFIEKYLNPYHYIKAHVNYRIKTGKLKEGEDLFKIDKEELYKYELFYYFHTDIDKLSYDYFITEKAFCSYIDGYPFNKKEMARVEKIKKEYEMEKNKIILKENEKLKKNIKIPTFTYRENGEFYDVIPGIFVEKYLGNGPLKAKINYYRDNEKLFEGTNFFKIDNLKKYKRFYEYYCNIDNYKYDYLLTKKAVDMYINSNTSVIPDDGRSKLVCESFEKRNRSIEDLTAFDLLQFDEYELSNVIQGLNRILQRKHPLDELNFYKLLDSKFKITYEIEEEIIDGILVPYINKYISKDCLIYVLNSLESSREIIYSKTL